MSGVDSHPPPNFDGVDVGADEDERPAPLVLLSLGQLCTASQVHWSLAFSIPSVMIRQMT